MLDAIHDFTYITKKIRVRIQIQFDVFPSEVRLRMSLDDTRKFHFYTSFPSIIS